MERTEMQVLLRQDMSKSHLKEMRRGGRIPASLYGKGKPALALEVGLASLAHAVRTEAGVHTIIDLQIDGAKRGEGGTAVIKSVQKDPLTRRILHVDFQRVSLSDMVVTPLEVVLHGDSPGAREGGVLEQVMNEIEVRCRADHIPPRLDVDVSNLQIGQFVHAGDVPLPEGVELAARPDDIVVALRPPHVHAVPKVEAMPEAEAVPEVEIPKPAAEGETERSS